MCVMQTSSMFTWSAAEVSPTAIIVVSSSVGFSTSTVVTTLFESRPIEIFCPEILYRRLTKNFLFKIFSFLALFAFKCTTRFLLFVHNFSLLIYFCNIYIDCARLGTYCLLTTLKVKERSRSGIPSKHFIAACVTTFNSVDQERSELMHLLQVTCIFSRYFALMSSRNL